MRSFYLVLAVVGAIIPLAFFAQFFFAGGIEAAPLDFIPALFVNGAGMKSRAACREVRFSYSPADCRARNSFALSRISCRSRTISLQPYHNA